MIKDIKLQLKNGINEKEFKAISFILFFSFLYSDICGIFKDI